MSWPSNQNTNAPIQSANQNMQKIYQALQMYSQQHMQQQPQGTQPPYQPSQVTQQPQLPQKNMGSYGAMNNQGPRMGQGYPEMPATSYKQGPAYNPSRNYGPPSIPPDQQRINYGSSREDRNYGTGSGGWNSNQRYRRYDQQDAPPAMPEQQPRYQSDMGYRQNYRSSNYPTQHSSRDYAQPPPSGEKPYYQDRRQPAQHQQQRLPYQRRYADRSNERPPRKNETRQPRSHHEKPASSSGGVESSEIFEDPYFVGNSSFSEEIRNTAVVEARYPRMKIPLEFVYSRSNWTTLLPVEDPVEIYGNEIDFEFVNERREGDDARHSSRAPTHEGTKYNAKIALFNRIAFEDPGERAGAPSKHLFQRLRFVVGKKEKDSFLLLLGGAWNEKDGEDPTKDDTLLRTAARSVKEVAGIEIEEYSTDWIRFMEIHYHRPAGHYHGKDYDAYEEITVVYVPRRVSFEREKAAESSAEAADEELAADGGDEKSEEGGEEEAADMIPLSPERQTDAVDAEDGAVKDVSREEEEHSVKLTIASSKHTGVKAKAISLYGLLEYNEKDTHEKTFEISLFAEFFKEVLYRKVAHELFNYLSERAAAHEDSPVKKRKAKNDEEEGKDDEVKKRKTKNGDEDESPELEEEEAAEEDARSKSDDAEAEKEKETGEKAASDGGEINAVDIDLNLLQSFQMLDFDCYGFVHCDDIIKLIYNIDVLYSMKQIQELFRPFGANPSRIFYPKVCETKRE